MTSVGESRRSVTPRSCINSAIGSTASDGAGLPLRSGAFTGAILHVERAAPDAGGFLLNAEGGASPPPRTSCPSRARRKRAKAERSTPMSLSLRMPHAIADRREHNKYKLSGGRASRVNMSRRLSSCNDALVALRRSPLSAQRGGASPFFRRFEAAFFGRPQSFCGVLVRRRRSRRALRARHGSAVVPAVTLPARRSARHGATAAGGPSWRRVSAFFGRSFPSAPLGPSGLKWSRHRLASYRSAYGMCAP